MARRVINSPLLGDGVPGHPAEIHVQIAAEYVSEFVPCPARLPRVLFTELFTRMKCDKRVLVRIERLSAFSKLFLSNFYSLHYSQRFETLPNNWTHFSHDCYHVSSGLFHFLTLNMTSDGLLLFKKNIA